MLLPFVLKLAILYRVESQRVVLQDRFYEPTYRVSWQVAPELKRPRISAAISEVDRHTGAIKPVGIVRFDPNTNRFTVYK